LELVLPAVQSAFSEVLTTDFRESRMEQCFMNRPASTFRYIYIVGLLSGATLALAAGLQQPHPTMAKVVPASVQQTMDLLIDPASDKLWASVGTEVTAHGTRDRAPQTDVEWLKVSGYAQSLVDGAKRLQTPRLPVGANAHSRLADADTPGTRTAAQIRADIDADPARFQAAASRLEAAANDALTAAHAHNAAGVLTAGAALDAACEACHAAYWYPRTSPQHLPSPEEFAAKALRP
jgi:cytochrome c556